MELLVGLRHNGTRVCSSGPNFIGLLSTKNCLAWNFSLDKNRNANSWIPIRSNIQQIEIWLAILFLSWKKFHAKQLYEIGPRCGRRVFCIIIYILQVINHKKNLFRFQQLLYLYITAFITKNLLGCSQTMAFVTTYVKWFWIEQRKID